MFKYFSWNLITGRILKSRGFIDHIFLLKSNWELWIVLRISLLHGEWQTLLWTINEMNPKAVHRRSKQQKAAGVWMHYWAILLLAVGDSDCTSRDQAARVSSLPKKICPAIHSILFFYLLSSSSTTLHYLLKLHSRLHSWKNTTWPHTCL